MVPEIEDEDLEKLVIANFADFVNNLSLEKGNAWNAGHFEIFSDLQSTRRGG